MVPDDCTRVVHEDALRIPAGQPNAKVRLLATKRPGPDSAEISGEASRFEKSIPAKGHVGPHQIADGGDLAWHAAVGAADDPVELRREPGRATGFPLRKDLATHPDDGGVLVMVSQAGQPGWVGLCVVVEEGDDAAPSRSNTGVSGIGQPGWPLFEMIVSCRRSSTPAAAPRFWRARRIKAGQWSMTTTICAGRRLWRDAERTARTRRCHRASV